MVVTKIIAYVRVSTEEQARDGVSIQAQIAKIGAWRELNAPEAEIHVFADEGVSGRLLNNREQLQKALEAADEGSALVVYSISRLSRTTQHMLNIADALDKKGVELVSLSEHIDTTTAAGKMVFRMLSVLVEFERDLISERTKMALAHLKATGQRYSRFPDYPEHVRERCAELRDKGLSYRKIAARLTKEGYETVGGGKWHPNVVRNLARKQGSR